MKIMQLRGVVSSKSLLIVLLLLFWEAVTSAIILSTRNNGSICTERLHRFATRYVTYMETFKKPTWGGLFKKTTTRINYRYEKFIELYDAEKCCEGYKEIVKKPLNCHPVCKDDCSNGICVKPNTCMCFLGYRNEFIKDWNQCVPDCHGNKDDPNGCGGHGQCIAPNKCQCHTGYTQTILKSQFGETHLVPPCVPECKTDCGANGYCQEPNKCQCNVGYQLSSSDSTEKIIRCLPICEMNCVNGICLAPNQCGCHQGYKQSLIDHYLCEPICMDGCINAICTGPNYCECHHGYEKNPLNPPQICTPVCKSSCVNGNCTLPNYCECHVGYKKISDKPMEICSPVCDPPCINGTCTGPDYCECHDGYAKNLTRHECSPICDPPCINADCVEPNQCECLNGYRTTLESPIQACLPICDPDCVNATCTRPGNCECLEGYEKKSELSPQICSPVCNPSCINSDCIKPNYCECHLGFQMNSGSEQVCSPVCDPSCVNGDCYQPNHCRCYDGYTNKLPHEPQLCSPVCDPPCGSNAWCEFPNECTCDLGYIAVNLTSTSTTDESLTDSNFTFLNVTICKPFCIPECNKNASCVKPNLCQCDTGYRSATLSDEASNHILCLPICDNDCVNGFCGYPNKCICHLGYVPSPGNDFACEPFCEQDCINGKCTQPNYCECQDGYEKPKFGSVKSYENLKIFENICVPSCLEECLGGTCIAPGQCLCYPGYILTKSIDSSQQYCQPLCEPDCPTDWKCVGPNHCQSPDGFVQDNDRFSTSLPDIFNTTKNCSDKNNFFDDDGTCICKYGWAGSRCDQPSFCVMIFGVDDFTNESFSILPSSDTENNRTKGSDYDEANGDSGETLVWKSRACKEECRISVFSSNFFNFDDKIIHCHQRIILNNTDHLFTTDEQLLNASEKNKTIICFVRAGVHKPYISKSLESECSLEEIRVSKFRGTSYGIHVYLGVGLVLAASVLVILVIYVRCQKTKNAKLTAVASMGNIIIDWADNQDSHHNTTIESSTL